MVTIYSVTYYLIATKGFAWQFTLSGSQVRAWWIHESPQSCCILCTIYFMHCKYQLGFPWLPKIPDLLSSSFSQHISVDISTLVLYLWNCKNRRNISHSVLTTNSCALLSSSDSDSPARAVGRSDLCDMESSCLPLNAGLTVLFHINSPHVYSYPDLDKCILNVITPKANFPEWLNIFPAVLSPQFAFALLRQFRVVF